MKTGRNVYRVRMFIINKLMRLVLSAIPHGSQYDNARDQMYCAWGNITRLHVTAQYDNDGKRRTRAEAEDIRAEAMRSEEQAAYERSRQLIA